MNVKLKEKQKKKYFEEFKTFKTFFRQADGKN